MFILLAPSHSFVATTLSAPALTVSIPGKWRCKKLAAAWGEVARFDLTRGEETLNVTIRDRNSQAGQIVIDGLHSLIGMHQDRLKKGRASRLHVFPGGRFSESLVCRLRPKGPLTKGHHLWLVNGQSIVEMTITDDSSQSLKTYQEDVERIVKLTRLGNTHGR